MISALDAVIDLVAAHGMDRVAASTVAVYIADRCAGLSLATVHSSSSSSLRHDPYLADRFALAPRQIGAWLALIRGTRAARQRDGLIVGGYPSMVKVLTIGAMDEHTARRFDRLAQIAATGRRSRCGGDPMPVGRRNCTTRAVR